MEMPSRQMSEKVKLWGIFPGAKVKRGPDWKWNNQDGRYKNVSYTAYDAKFLNSLILFGISQ